MKSTIFCRVASGSSPGIMADTAMAATSTADKAPRYDCQLVSILLMMSMRLSGCQKPSRRLISSQIVENTAPETNATSHSFVLMV